MEDISEDEKEFFDKEGYLVVKNLLTAEQVTYYSDLYNSFLKENGLVQLDSAPAPPPQLFSLPIEAFRPDLPPFQAVFLNICFHRR